MPPSPTLSPKNRAVDVAYNNRRARVYLEALQEANPSSLPCLPTCFNSSERSPHIVLREPHNLRAEYKGPGESEVDSAQVRGNYEIPVECGIYYFEVRVLNNGKDGLICVGLCTKDSRINKLPGWDRGSLGYHGFDGKKYRGCTSGDSYGPTFTTGDTVGCLINFMSSTVSFTKNGILLGVAFAEVGDKQVYPVIGMRSSGECIEANFGSEAFCFDFQGYIKEERRRVYEVVHDTTIPDMDNTLASTILSYLIQQGFPESALVFARSVGKEQEVTAKLQGTRQRREVLDLITQGKIDEVIQLLRLYYPRVFEFRQDVIFMLKCLKFIELIRANAENVVSTEVVLNYGCEELQAVYDKEQEPFPCSNSGSTVVVPPVQCSAGLSFGGTDMDGVVMDGVSATSAAAAVLSPSGRSPTTFQQRGTSQPNVSTTSTSTSSRASSNRDGRKFRSSDSRSRRSPLSSGRSVSSPNSDCSSHGNTSEGIGLCNDGKENGGLLSSVTTISPFKVKQYPHYRRREILDRLFSLIAFTTPSQSPYSYLLHPEMRVEVSHRVNQAILGVEGERDQMLILERIARQTRAVVDQLEGYSIVGRMLKDVVPLGYDRTESSRKNSSLSVSISHFFDL